MIDGGPGPKSLRENLLDEAELLLYCDHRFAHFIYHKPAQRLTLTDPDPNLLKSAAAHLVELARSSTIRGRYRKSAKIEALRSCKDEIWKRTAAESTLIELPRFSGSEESTFPPSI